MHWGAAPPTRSCDRPAAPPVPGRQILGTGGDQPADRKARKAARAQRPVPAQFPLGAGGQAAPSLDGVALQCLGDPGTVEPNRIPESEKDPARKAVRIGLPPGVQAPPGGVLLEAAQV